MFCILLLVFVVSGGCHKEFDRLDCIVDSKIIVLLYLVLVLLVLLALCRIFGSLLVSLGCSIWERYMFYFIDIM